MSRYRLTADFKKGKKKRYSFQASSDDNALDIVKMQLRSWGGKAVLESAHLEVWSGSFSGGWQTVFNQAAWFWET